MFGFKKNELIFVLVSLVAISLLTVVNLSASYRKSRDVNRKNNLGDIEDRLQKFHERLGFYPPATEDGKIMGCDGYVNEVPEWVFSACEWGENPKNSPFFSVLPKDPNHEEGARYVYFSNKENFQILVGLEGPAEDEYDPKIKERNILCGKELCTAGRASLGPKSLWSELPPPNKNK